MPPEKRNAPPEVRFWRRVSVTSACWLWRGYVNPFGYGRFKVAGRMVAAHRFSWGVHFGEVPDGLCVLHRCDVPACVNPDHLFLGTPADNNEDMEKKGRGRHPRGEASGTSKLTVADILAIRSDTRTQAEIARDYGIGQQAVSRVKTKNTWRHVHAA